MPLRNSYRFLYLVWGKWGTSERSKKSTLVVEESGSLQLLLRGLIYVTPTATVSCIVYLLLLLPQHSLSVDDKMRLATIKQCWMGREPSNGFLTYHS